MNINMHKFICMRHTKPHLWRLTRKRRTHLCESRSNLVVGGFTSFGRPLNGRQSGEKEATVGFGGFIGTDCLLRLPRPLPGRGEVGEIGDVGGAGFEGSAALGTGCGLKDPTLQFE